MFKFQPIPTKNKVGSFPYKLTQNSKLSTFQLFKSLEQNMNPHVIKKTHMLFRIKIQFCQVGFLVCDAIAIETESFKTKGWGERLPATPAV